MNEAIRYAFLSDWVKEATQEEIIEKLIEHDERAKEIKHLQQRVEQLENIRKEAFEFVEWHYKDNKEFFKNKGIGLNYPECDYLLNTLNKGSE